MNLKLLTLAAALALPAAFPAPRLDAQEAQRPRRSVGIAMSVDQDGAMYVQDVIKGSPAEKAGLKAGDQIASIAGIAVAQLDPQAVPGIVDTAKVIPIVVIRNGERLTLTVEPAVMPPGSMPATRTETRMGPP